MISGFSIIRKLTAAKVLAFLRTADAEYLKTGDERRAVIAHETAVDPHRQYATIDRVEGVRLFSRTVVAAHETAPHPHRQYTTSDQATLAAQFFG